MTRSYRIGAYAPRPAEAPQCVVCGFSFDFLIDLEHDRVADRGPTAVVSEPGGATGENLAVVGLLVEFPSGPRLAFHRGCWRDFVGRMSIATTSLASRGGRYPRLLN
jgi:hypothetical protein